ncbi:MAG: IS1595 family transposase [Candidatus Korobacteraceae bacterium]|jgi:transposase-like protein
MFSTDEQCRNTLKRLRWPMGVECIRCKSKRVFEVATQKKFECVECGYQFSVLTQTIFHDTHLPLETWFMAVLLLVEARKGMSALQLKRTLWGLNRGSYKTAWYLCHRIRRAMKQVEQPMLDGTIEMDETYVGGKKLGQGRSWHKRMSNKEVVIGIRQRNQGDKPGVVRFFHAEDAKSGTLARYIQENISTDVDVIVTDELPAYQKAVGDHAHETVNHGRKEYVRFGTDIHTNTVENSFSLLKRGIVGSWHKISAKHLQAYLDEMSFRFDRRKNPDLFVDTLRHMITADPLTFEELTAA